MRKKEKDSLLGSSNVSDNYQPSTRFTPISIQNLIPPAEKSDTKVTATTTLKGVTAEEFEAMAKNSGLNKSQLLTQMVYHCLNRTENLKNFYKRLAILGK